MVTPGGTVTGFTVKVTPGAEPPTVTLSGADALAANPFVPA
jgi:hypothetical protein